MREKEKTKKKKKKKRACKQKEVRLVLHHFGLVNRRETDDSIYS